GRGRKRRLYTGLHLQPPLRPEAGVECLALGVRQAAIPAWFASYALKERIDPRPIRSDECRRIVTMAHMYCARPRLREQRGAFERALPSAYNEDALASESVGCGAVAGVRAEFGREQCCQFVGDVGKRSETGGEQHPVRRQYGTIVQARLETAVALVESRDTQRSRMDVVHLLEPLGVLQVEVERERLDVGRLLAACLKKALEGVSLRGIQVPVAPGAK